jgi:hypothetical protein
MFIQGQNVCFSNKRECKTKTLFENNLGTKHINVLLYGKAPAANERSGLVIL